MKVLLRNVCSELGAILKIELGKHYEDDEEYKMDKELLEKAHRWVTGLAISAGSTANPLHNQKVKITKWGKFKIREV